MRYLLPWILVLLVAGPAEAGETLDELLAQAMAKRNSEPQAALKLSRKALELARARPWSKQHADLDCEAKAANNLGNTLLRSTGDFENALIFFQRAVQLKRQLKQPTLPNSMMNLALVYNRRGSPKEALPLLLEAERIAASKPYKRPGQSIQAICLGAPGQAS